MELCQIVDLKPECFEEYNSAHQAVPVEAELKEVGLGHIRVHFWKSPDAQAPIRLVMTGLWTPTREGETWEQAMERYMTLNGVKEWEEWMDRLKIPLPGMTGPGWQRASALYKSPGT
jgi:hypothetical protein